MSTAPLELFWFSGSPFSWQVMLTLEVKEVPYISRLLQGSKGEHRNPDFLALNPRGKVPTLRHGDFVVYESMAIMQYLEQMYPARPIFGRTAREAALIWRSISEFSSYLQPPLWRVVVPLLTGKSQENAADLRAALPQVHPELERLEASTSAGGWLAGTEVTAADLVVYPFLKLLRRAAGNGEARAFDLRLLPLEERYPRLLEWMEQVERLPGYDRTYPPHWNP